MRVGLLTLLLIAACSSPPRGSVGSDCPNDRNCLPGLRCVEGKCAEAPLDAGMPRDAGPRDVGPADAGNDAGVEEPDGGEMDAGPVCPIPPQLSRIQAQIFGADGQPDCNQASCHGQSAAGGIQLTLPLAELRQELLGPTQDTAAAEANIVVPGDPDNSRLYVIMSQPDPQGNGTSMPPTRLLDPCDIETVRKWIEDGALEN